LNGIIFDIQRFSIDDGPGIRTVVFLKGCNMRCLWCHNPESQNSHAEIMYYPQKCIGCGKCVDVCPHGAHIIENGKITFLRKKCINCGKCVQECHTGALTLTGKTVSVEEVMLEIKKDDLYYKNSGGGITFSGGEPLLQVDFLMELLIECEKLNYHCAIETAGNVEWEVFEKIIPYTDLFLYDIKLIDDINHKKSTGVSNKRIIENLKKLSVEKVEVWVRTPLIPSINDNPNDIKEISDLISSLKTIKKHEFLPYNSLGESKYESLGLKCDFCGGCIRF
jgi:glycyl-radical enzyme activating protein